MTWKPILECSFAAEGQEASMASSPCKVFPSGAEKGADRLAGQQPRILTLAGGKTHGTN